MKLLRATALMVAAIAVGAVVWAFDSGKAAAGQGPTFVLAIQDLNLTDAQEEKITDIRKESRPKIREAAKELDTLAKEEVEKLKGVLTADQVKKVQEMKEEREDRREDCLAHAFMNLKELDLTESEMAKIGEIRKEFRPKIEKAIKELDGLLTDAQKRNREEAIKAGKKRKELLAALELTGTQVEKVQTVGKDVATLVREETEKIHEVLTDEQKRTLTELKDERHEHVRDRMAHRIANARELNLTDDQKAKILEIRKEFRPKIQEAGNKVRSDVRDEAEKIVAVIKG
jgi:Spy/CpxP family protein refolding chaperone